MNLSKLKISSRSQFTIYAALYLTFLYGPILFLPLFSFNDSIYVAFPLKGFTFKWYEQLVSSPTLIRALGNSLQVAIPVSLISTALGTLAAMAVSRHKLRGMNAMTALIGLPLVIPEIVLGISLLVLASSGGISLNLVTVSIGHILLCMPLAMLVMISRFQGADPSYEEASQDLGENPFVTFWRVTFPIAIPGLLASVLLTFTISFDEFVLAFFLSGTEPTLPVYIWSQLRFPAKLPGVMALGSCVLLMTFILIVAVGLLRKNGPR